MPSVRASEWVLWTAGVMTALAGCVGGRLSSETPAGVRLDGLWKLNRGASDDPQKIIDQMRAQALKRASRRVGPGPEPGTMPNPAKRGRDTNAHPEDPLPDEDEEAAAPRAPAGPRRDPLQGSPVLHQLMSNITRGEFLTVRQGSEQFVLDYGGSTRGFTPGGHSVVSAEGGVADQFSGWRGKEYVIDVKPQQGGEVIERYGLSPDGRHLVVKLHFSGADTPRVDLTRVYDPTSEIAPRTLPSID